MFSQLFVHIYTHPSVCTLRFGISVLSAIVICWHLIRKSSHAKKQINLKHVHFQPYHWVRVCRTCPNDERADKGSAEFREHAICCISLRKTVAKVWKQSIYSKAELLAQQVVNRFGFAFAVLLGFRERRNWRKNHTSAAFVSIQSTVKETIPSWPFLSQFL